MGWSLGPEKLIRMMLVISNYTFFCASVPAQIAMARSLDAINTADALG